MSMKHPKIFSTSKFNLSKGPSKFRPCWFQTENVYGGESIWIGRSRSSKLGDQTKALTFPCQPWKQSIIKMVQVKDM